MRYFSEIRTVCEDREEQGCTYLGIVTSKAERIVCCDYRPSRITSSDDHNLLLIVDPGLTELNEVAPPGKYNVVAANSELLPHFRSDRF